ncbi:MAG TPA: hypothetical protein VL332_06195 [Candidatus Saccharimonadaceae bacterium]|nr:hypothetical protein [Candidatus Saccharimonadaceae bacterium]
MPSTRFQSPGATAKVPETWLAALALAGAAAVVFHGALRYGFSQDDFASLARASGLLPRLHAPWRYLANQGFWDAMRVVAGKTAWPYHAAALALHVAATLLLRTWLARRVSAPAAWLGAAFFATHPALFTALYWVSAISDPMAVAAALAALLLFEREDAARWLAVPAFAIALLAKESVLPLPLVALSVAALSPGRARRALLDPVAIALFVVGAAYAVYFVRSAYPAYFVAPGGAAGGRAAYAAGLGPHVLANALTLTGWAANAWWPTVRGVADAVDASVFPWAYAAIALWLGGLAWPRLRASGWLEGGVLFAGFLLPVVALSHHTYHYYLTAPLIGMAWCVAALADATLRPVRATATGDEPPPGAPGTPLGWSIAVALGALLTWNGAALVRRIETAPFTDPHLRSDATVDRALIASRLSEALDRASLPAHARLALWSPSSIRVDLARFPRDQVLARDTYWERNVRAALAGGIGLIVLHPQVDSVAFLHAYAPQSASTWFVLYDPDGHARVETAARVDSMMRSSPPW